MIKIDKDDVSITGDTIEITTELVLAINNIINVIYKDKEDILFGAIFTGVYHLHGKENHKKCYEMSKLLVEKCKELKNREN